MSPALKIIICVRKSPTDRGPISSQNPYKAAGLYTTTTFPIPPSADALLNSLLSVLPASRILLRIYPQALHVASWTVYPFESTRSVPLATYAPTKKGLRALSAASPKNSKLYLLPREPLNLDAIAAEYIRDIPPNSVQLPLHPRIMDNFAQFSYTPKPDILSTVGQVDCTIIISSWLCRNIAALIITPIVSLILAAAHTAPATPCLLVLTRTAAQCQQIADSLRSLLQGSLLEGSVHSIVHGPAPCPRTHILVLALPFLDAEFIGQALEHIVLVDLDAAPVGPVGPAVVTLRRDSAAAAMGVNALRDHDTLPAAIQPLLGNQVQDCFKYFPAGVVLVFQAPQEEVTANTINEISSFEAVNAESGVWYVRRFQDVVGLVFRRLVGAILFGREGLEVAQFVGEGGLVLVVE